MVSRSTWILATILALFVLLSLLSCAPAVDPDEPDPDENDVDVEPEPDPVEEPEERQRVVVAVDLDVVSWDPPQDWLTIPESITENAYDYLYLRNHEGSDWVPELAHSWEWIDNQTVRFYLNEGVKFHDGTELTAEDVRYHYRRIIDGTREEYILRGQYEWIDDIIVHDDYTFDVVAHEPDGLMLWKLTQQNNGAGIVSKAYVEEVGIEGVHREPMGTGPWVLREHIRDEHVLFDRNEDYWQTDRFPNFEEFEFRVIPEASTRIAELMTGGIDVAYRVLPQDEDRLKDASGVDAVWVAGGTGYFLGCRPGPLSTENYPEPDFAGDPELDREFTTRDPRIREAIERAIDKYALRDIAGGHGEAFRARAFQPLPEGDPDLFGPSACLYDPERAKELIAEAGYEPGEATLVFNASTNWPIGDLARVITGMLEDVGFDVDLRLMDLTTHRNLVSGPRKFQELSLGTNGGNLNPHFAHASYLSTRHLRAHWVQPTDAEWQADQERIDELYRIGESTTDEQERIEAFRELSNIAAEQRTPWISLFQESNLYGISDRIEWNMRADEEIMGYDFKVVQ